MVALSVVEADFLECAQRGVGFHPFSDGAQVHRQTDLADGRYHFTMNWIFRDALDQAAVDLDVVDLKVLQVAERT